MATGSFSFAGIGSGLDVSSMISQLRAVDLQALKPLQTTASKLNAQLSSVGLMKSYVTNIRDAAQALSKPELWANTTSTSSDEKTLKVTSSSGAVPGNFSVSVEQLAKPQTAQSALIAKDQTFSVGEITIKSGSKSPVTLNLGSDSASLESVARKINDAKAGVTATVISGEQGKTLVYQSADGGASNTFSVDITDNSASKAAVANISFNMSFGASQAAMAETAKGQDAKATINGVAVTSSSNTFKSVMQNVDITVSALTEANKPVQVSVANSSDELMKAMDNFVKVYNDYSKFVKDQTKYDAATKKGGALQGDSATIGLQRQMRQALTGGTTIDGSLQLASSFGLSVGSDGVLSLDKSKFTKALQDNPAALQKAFSTAGDANGNGIGIMARMAQTTKAVLDTGGLLDNRTEGLNKLIKSNQANQDKVTERADSNAARLQTQFQRLDTIASKNNALQSYVTTQLAALNRYA
ncbi:flagellar filament capping protein FliD [Amphibiibacter pelophylacis]|uniref:Flagellar filament capping protein FliD n=1 Tax=Amphibiibacter pelophylacis TaxID=1799477 RepID=A0ACC6P3C4_9BURK